MLDTVDPWVMLGLMSTGASSPGGGVPDSTVWVSEEAVEQFSKDYNWEFIKRQDGSFQVHYYMVSK